MIGTARFKPKTKLMNEANQIKRRRVEEHLFTDVWYF